MGRPHTVDAVVASHVDEAVHLYELRAILYGPRYVTTHALRRHDDRLAAHLDGVAVAGNDAWLLLDAALKSPSAGIVFAAAVRAIEEKQEEKLNRLFTLASDGPETRDALIAAFGWVEPRHLQGTVAALLNSTDPLRRIVGLAACALHRVDPGLANGPWFADEDQKVRARAFRTAGEIGRLDLLATLGSAMTDEDAECQFWAAWSAVLLGDRSRGVAALARTGLATGNRRTRAFRLALQALPPEKGHVLLQQLTSDPAQVRLLIQGCGLVGDPAYVPWLIKRMGDDASARLAGEAFTLISGADLDRLRLERQRPDTAEGEPNENPEDEHVAMDPDDGLPWPEPQRVQQWWDANGNAFQPGTRYFVGAPVTLEQGIDVLKNGYQRQRILAAHHLCLLRPGTPLFDTSAPACRQQKMLAQM